MAHGKFEFRGVGLEYLWLFIWTNILTLITLGIFAPWGAVRLYRWVAGNTYFADPGDVEYLVEAKGAEKVKKVEYCPNCGSKLSPDALFCEQCGNRM